MTVQYETKHWHRLQVKAM